MNTESLVQYLDEYLSIKGFPDYSRAQNGLQVEGPTEVTSVAVAVDVTGPLDEPKFKPVTRTIASSAVGAVLRNALKPAGLVLRPLRILETKDSASRCQGPFDPAIGSFEMPSLRADQ